MRRMTAALLSAVLAARLAAGQSVVPPVAATNQQRLAAWDATNAAVCRAPERFLLRRAVLADRQARTVTLLAESCGLAAHAIVEFGIVGETSDRTYEALFRAYARAIDIGDALEFIGMPRGRNVSSKAQRYWPAGERVLIQVQPLDGTNPPPRNLEDYILDKQTGGVLPRTGFVYCGSPRVPNPDGAGDVCLADLDAPVSFLSLYNEPQTLLDVPRIAHQGEVYERYTANPQGLLPEARQVRLVLSPEPRADGRPRMRPLTLAVVSAPGPGGVAFDLADARQDAVRIDSFGDLLKRLMALVDEACDPMVALRFDDNLPLARVREVCKVIQRIEGENGIRVEPPPEGQLYYKAYLPDDNWRDRAKRLSQPWELHVGKPESGRAVPPLRLVKTLEDWSDPASIEPRLTPVEHPLATFDELPAVLEREGRGLPVLLVFAPGEAPVGLFLQGIRRVLDTHATVYVFAE
jgi:hypothetical protein